MSYPEEKPLDDPRSILDRSFDVITKKQRDLIERAEKDRLKLEAKLTSRLQTILETEVGFSWELIPAHSKGGQGWSDFKNRLWGSNGRPIAVTQIEEGLFVSAHFNENLFNQFSFGVITEKPPYNFAEVGKKRSSSANGHTDDDLEIETRHWREDPVDPYDYSYHDSADGVIFLKLSEFGEAVIKARSGSTN